MISAKDAASSPLSHGQLGKLAAKATDGQLSANGDELRLSEEEAVKRRKIDSKANLKECRTWAAASVKGGGKAVRASVSAFSDQLKFPGQRPRRAGLRPGCSGPLA